MKLCFQLTTLIKMIPLRSRKNPNSLAGGGNRFVFLGKTSLQMMLEFNEAFRKKLHWKSHAKKKRNTKIHIKSMSTHIVYGSMECSMRVSHDTTRVSQTIIEMPSANAQQLQWKIDIFVFSVCRNGSGSCDGSKIKCPAWNRLYIMH